MRTAVQKWGNSLALRLPKALAQPAELEEGTFVDLVPTDEGILVRPLRPPRYRLSELVAGVTSKNLHPESDWGHSTGQEILK
jgi:antitoxin MazE